MLSDTQTMTGRDFQKIAEVNRYIELCNPFPRINNSFPQNGEIVLSDCKPFHRYGQSVFWYCNSFTRFKNAIQGKYIF